MADQFEPVPSSVLFAQIDRTWAIQDYAPGFDCVRLIGVSESSFRSAAFNSDQGCQTFIIDLAWSDFQSCQRQFPPSHHHVGTPQGLDYDDSPAKLWIEIRYLQRPIGQAASYAYAAFADDEPTYIEVRSIQPAVGTEVMPLGVGAAPVSPFTLTSSAEWLAFHVGQGMCTLFHDGTDGYLLDAGAGIPVLRPEYRGGMHASGATFVNELRPLATSLGRLTVVLSHPDSDHWRLLDWDAAILSKANVIYLPAGVPALAFSAPVVKGKVVGASVSLSSASFSLIATNSLEVLRSAPLAPDRNGDCLITLVHCGTTLGIISGDYVYSRMLSDADPLVVAAAAGAYDAVVVPHHGDFASRLNVPTAVASGKSIAYFSAGTHSGYNHPNVHSDSAHRAHFKVISDRTKDDVLKTHLLP